MLLIFVVFHWFLFVCYSELLFADANFNITRSVIRTLGCGDELDHGVVDLFTYLLNHYEKLKDPQSLSSRFFFSCNACVSMSLNII